MNTPIRCRKISVPAAKAAKRRLLGMAAAAVLGGAIVVRMTCRFSRSDGGDNPLKEAMAAAAAIQPARAPLPKKQREDFSHLPPRERINAETNQRIGEEAAWREELRSGNYTTLPPEALPAGVPPHPAASWQ